MISVEEASSIIDSHLKYFRSKRVSQNVIADRDYPPYHRATMDGIAVKLSSLQQGQREFFIEGISAAGMPLQKLTDPTHCREIMTGAVLPEGADVVIPYEHLENVNGRARLIKEAEYVFFENIHRQGSDCKAGDILVKAGEKLQGPHRGIAASFGFSVADITEKSPRILLVSTGDELVSASETPLPHQIRGSNTEAMKQSLENHGYVNVERNHLPDNESVITDHYLENSKKFDVMIYSGGVSKGKYDYLPSVWQKCGVQRRFHQVAQKPGKPLWFGVDEIRNTLVVGLPGNPISSLVCLHRYFLRGRELHARLTEDVKINTDLTYFAPAKLISDKSGVLYAQPIKMKNSGEFTVLAGTDGFIELSGGPQNFSQDSSHRFFLWDGLI